MQNMPISSCPFSFLFILFSLNLCLFKLLLKGTITTLECNFILMFSPTLSLWLATLIWISDCWNVRFHEPDSFLTEQKCELEGDFQCFILPWLFKPESISIYHTYYFVKDEYPILATFDQNGYSETVSSGLG